MTFYVSEDRVVGSSLGGNQINVYQPISLDDDEQLRFEVKGATIDSSGVSMTNILVTGIVGAIKLILAIW